METNAPSQSGNELLTPSVAARLVGLTAAGINGAAARGRLPIAIRTTDGRRLYLLVDVLRFKADREAAAETTR